MFKRVFFIFIIIILFTTCGLKYETIFNSPSSVDVDDDIKTEISITFTADNQEKDLDKYLLAGYDVYYYFEKSSDSKLAMVKDPVFLDDDNRNPKLIDFVDDEPDRFPEDPFDNIDIYQDITIPVTEDMIEDILKEGENDNVVIYFHDHDINNDSGEKNPYDDSDRVIIDEVYPKYSDYKNQSWGDEDFKGFYDIDFYNAQNVDPVEDTATYSIYKVYFYIIAKGFNSDIERDDSYVKSVKSSTVEVGFKVEK